MPEPKRSDYHARKARREMVRSFVYVIILGLVVGLGVVFKDPIIAWVNKATQSDTTSRQPSPPTPTPPAKKIVETPETPPTPLAKPPVVVEKPKLPVEPPPEARVGVDDAAAKDLIDRGRAALEKLAFDEAAGLFKDASRRKVSASVRSAASAWERRATTYQQATQHIPVSEYATAEESLVIETQDGREISGLKKAEKDGQIILQIVPAQNPATLGKTTIPIPLVDVKSQKRLSLQQRREEFLQLLGVLEASAQITRSTDYYDLVYISKRLSLNRECLEYLNRAYNGGPGHDADPYLGDSFRKEVIRRTIDRCSLMLAGGRAKRFVEDELVRLQKTLPGYDVAMDEAEAFRIKVMSKVTEDFHSTLKLNVVKTEVASAPEVKQASRAREIVSEERIEISVENDTVRGKGAAATLVSSANAKYEEGMKAYRGFRQGTNGNNNKILETAMRMLESAVDLYDQALKADPGNKAVLDRQTEANMIVYACKKYHTL